MKLSFPLMTSLMAICLIGCGDDRGRRANYPDPQVNPIKDQRGSYTSGSDVLQGSHNMSSTDGGIDGPWGASAYRDVRSGIHSPTLYDPKTDFKGMNREQLTRVQDALRIRGYLPRVGNDEVASTREGLRWFQQDRQLSVTGEADAATLRQLNLDFSNEASNRDRMPASVE